MLAWPGLWVRIDLKRGWEARFVPPKRRMLSRGENARLLQLPTWNREDSWPVEPLTEVAVPLTCSLEQFVGATMNLGLSIDTCTERMCNGTPFRIVGNGCDSTLNSAVRGST